MGKKQTAGQTPVRVAVKDLPTIRIDELIPYENNAKIHGPDQIEQLRRSLRQFGFVSPVLIDKDKNLIAGHGRVEAARAEGMTEVPYVTVSDLTEAQRRAYIIADNRLTEAGVWDAGRLKLEMRELQALEFDTDLTGFAMAEIISLAGDEPESEPKAHEDDYDGSVPEATAVRDGDIFQLGRHRLAVGSTADEAAMTRLMNGALANMVFTDPPYGVAVGSKNQMLDDVAGGKSGRCTEDIYGDTMSESDLHDMLLQAMTNIRLSCRDDASFYVTSPQGGSLGLMMMMMMMMREAGLEVRHMLIWKKSSPTFSMGRLNYEYQHEPILFTWTKKHIWYGNGKFHTSVWDVDKPRKCDLHPTMKPIALVENAILNSTTEGDLVLDGFGGSGTTLIACEQLGRTCYMMEIDPKYVQVIINRWEAMTGEKAVLLNDRARS